MFEKFIGDFIELLLKTVAQLTKKSWALKLIEKVARTINGMNSLKYKADIERTREIREEKERRVLDAILLRKEPDRIPVTTGGLNFFPAKYAGITCAEYMFDAKKMTAAYLKTNDDFDFDLTFP